MYENLPSKHSLARQQKAVWYFTGKPCKNGHIEKRLTSNGQCYVCSKNKILAWRNKSKSKLVEYNAQRWHNNKPREQARFKSWAAKHTAEQAARQSSRRCLRLQAMPKWVCQKSIKTVYSLKANLQKARGIIYHVDHIIPLKHKLICGLHVPWNLQILTAGENSKKKNHFDLTTYTHTFVNSSIGAVD